VTTFRHALMAFRTRFLFPLSDETRFCVSLLGQGQMGVAKWAGWAVILVAALVITSPRSHIGGKQEGRWVSQSNSRCSVETSEESKMGEDKGKRKG
jgi:hypothetical protein